MKRLILVGFWGMVLAAVADIKPSVSFIETAYDVVEGDQIVLRVFGGSEIVATSAKLYLSYQSASAADVDLGEMKFPLKLSWAAGEVGEKTIVIPTKQDVLVEDDEILSFQLAEPNGMTLGERRNASVFIYDNEVMASLQEAINCPSIKVSTSGDGKWFAAGGSSLGVAEIGCYHAESPNLISGQSSILNFKGLSGPTLLNVKFRFDGEESEMMTSMIRVLDGSELICTWRHCDVGSAWQNWNITMPADRAHDLKFVFSQGSNTKVHAWLCDVTRSTPAANFDDVCMAATAVFLESGLIKGGGRFQYGDTVKLTAIPRAGWVFDAWYTGSGDEEEYGGDNPVLSFIATGYLGIRANFWKIPYVRVLADPANGGKVTGSGYHKDGSKYTVTATPAKNFYFEGWHFWDVENQDICSDAMFSVDRKCECTVNIPNNLKTLAGTLYAKFVPYPMLTAAYDAARGKVTGSGQYAPEKKVTLKATANKGYVFAGWFLDTEYTQPVSGEYRNASFSYVMTKNDVTFYAKFIPTGDDCAQLDYQMMDEYSKGVPISTVVVKTDGCTSLPTVKVSGLPSGLKFTAKDVFRKGSKAEIEFPANSIYGTPTKSGVFTVVVTVTTAGKHTIAKSSTIVVRAGNEKVVKAIVSEIGGSVPGKVAGNGVYAEGKKVSLKATANKGYVFSGWYVGGTLQTKSASWSFNMGVDDLNCVARFITNAEDALGIELNVNGEKQIESMAAETNLMCGVKVAWPIEAVGRSATTVKVSGLPSGLKLVQDKTTKAYSVSGIPTATSKVKNGIIQPSVVKFTVTTAGKNKCEFAMNVVVDPFPTFLVGAYAGLIGRGEDNAWMAYGNITFSVAANGKISAKVIVPSGSYSFSALGWDAFRDGKFSVAMVTKKSEKLSLSLDAETDWCEARVSGKDEGNCFRILGHADFKVWAWRNEFGKESAIQKDPVATDFISRIVAVKSMKLRIVGNKDEGYDWAVLPSTDKTAELTLTFNTNGTVKYAGIVDGVRISGSTFLCFDGGDYPVIFDLVFPIGKTELMYFSFGFDRDESHTPECSFDVFRADFE